MTAILEFFGLNGAALIGAVLTALFEQYRAWLAERRGEEALKELGRVAAEREGAAAIGRIADQQAARATSPPSDEELLARLRGGTG